MLAAQILVDPIGSPIGVTTIERGVVVVTVALGGDMDFSLLVMLAKLPILCANPHHHVVKDCPFKGLKTELE